jgi:hypothetical protein
MYAVFDICHGAERLPAHSYFKCQWEAKKLSAKGHTTLNAERQRPASQRPVLASLVAFLCEGLRPRSMLARAIVFVLALKLVAVTGMMVFQRFAERGASVDTAAVGRLLGPSSLP